MPSASNIKQDDGQGGETDDFYDDFRQQTPPLPPKPSGPPSMKPPSVPSPPSVGPPPIPFTSEEEEEEIEREVHV